MTAKEQDAMYDELETKIFELVGDKLDKKMISQLANLTVAHADDQTVATMDELRKLGKLED